MARLKLTLPDELPYATELPVRITDLNYGGHLGNDAVLALLHEARMRFLASCGLSELDFVGASLIMSDVAIEFKNEAFYGEVLTAQVAAGEWSRVGFELYYRLTKLSEGRPVVVAQAKTGMICFDYQSRKVVPLPPEARQRLQQTP